MDGIQGPGPNTVITTPITIPGFDTTTDTISPQTTLDPLTYDAPMTSNQINSYQTFDTVNASNINAYSSHVAGYPILEGSNGHPVVGEAGLGTIHSLLPDILNIGGLHINVGMIGAGGSFLSQTAIDLTLLHDKGYYTSKEESKT